MAQESPLLFVAPSNGIVEAPVDAQVAGAYNLRNFWHTETHIEPRRGLRYHGRIIADTQGTPKLVSFRSGNDAELILVDERGIYAVDRINEQNPMKRENLTDFGLRIVSFPAGQGEPVSDGIISVTHYTQLDGDPNLIITTGNHQIYRLTEEIFKDGTTVGSWWEDEAQFQIRDIIRYPEKFDTTLATNTTDNIVTLNWATVQSIDEEYPINIELQIEPEGNNSEGYFKTSITFDDFNDAEIGDRLRVLAPQYTGNTVQQIVTYELGAEVYKSGASEISLRVYNSRRDGENAADRDIPNFREGTDKNITYSGQIWVTQTNPDRLLTRDLNIVHNFKGLLTYGVRNRLQLWYHTIAGTLPVNNQTVVDKFTTEFFFDKGGRIIYINSISRDTGAGIDDFLVIMTDQGQVGLFRTNDFTQSSPLIGIYNTARPLGPNAFCKVSGDILCATEEGLISILGLINSDLTYMSTPIRQLWRELVTKYPDNWSITPEVYRRDSMILIAPPSTEEEPVTLALNLSQNATGWTVFDISIDSSVVHKNKLFVCKGRSIWEYEGGQDEYIEPDRISLPADVKNKPVFCEWTPRHVIGHISTEKQQVRYKVTMRGNDILPISVSTNAYEKENKLTPFPDAKTPEFTVEERTEYILGRGEAGSAEHIAPTLRLTMQSEEYPNVKIPRIKTYNKTTSKS